MRILVIEDDEDFGDLIGDMLEALSIEFKVIGNCKEGLAILENGESFDIIFVDWNTPHMTGLEFTQAVRNSHKLRNIQLLMVTGKTDFDDVHKALMHGANEYLMKPFTSDMLKSKLKAFGYVDSDQK